MSDGDTSFFAPAWRTLTGLAARRVLLSSVLGFLGGFSCSSGPELQDPVAVLTLAEDHLDRGEPTQALTLLEAMDEDTFDGERRERYVVALATALHRNGYHWDGFEVIRDFGDEHAFSPYVNAVQDLEFDIGATLIRSDGGFLFFSSDRDDGQVVLEHFTVRWTHPAVPDALRLLGEKAFAEQDYALAKERFSNLLLKYENSEWVPLALFRMSMSWYHSLEGPEYDIQSLRRAHDELRDFLARGIENPTFHQEATDALVTVREWLGKKHLLIADFYETVGNTEGANSHREIVRQRYADTAAIGDLPAVTPEATEETNQ